MVAAGLVAFWIFVDRINSYKSGTNESRVKRTTSQLPLTQTVIYRCGLHIYADCYLVGEVSLLLGISIDFT